MADQVFNKKLLKGYEQYLRTMREPILKINRDNILNNFRRHRVTSRFRKKIFLDATEKANIDMAKIKRQQERDMTAMTNFLKKQRERVLENATLRLKRQKNIRKDMVRRSRILKNFQGNPVGVACLIRADAIIGYEQKGGAVDFSRSQGLIQRKSNFDNAAEVDISVDTSPGGEPGSYSQIIDFHFIWMPNMTGIVNSPIAELHINGGWQIETPPDCWDENHAYTIVKAFFQYAQTNLDGTPRQNVSIPGHKILEKSFTGGGSAGYVYYDQLVPFQDSLNLVAPSMEILSGYPVLFTVTIWVYVHADNGGSAEIDLRTGPYEINVPAIAYTIEY